MTEPSRVLAMVAHPDDIEFMMAGTLLRLKERGWDVHYLNVANGSCGTAVDDRDTIVAKRTAEAKAACALAGFTFHEPLCDDLAIFYTPELVAKASAVVRRVKPAMVLTQSPQDYMEDHMNAQRLAVTAAFTRGMFPAKTDPVTPAYQGDCAVYHALPYGLRDPMRRFIRPDFYVDVTPAVPMKREMLACHKSQKEWLDVSQGLDSYLRTMEDLAAQMGKMSGRYAYAEGWRRRLNLGFCADENADPLADALADLLVHVREDD